MAEVSFGVLPQDSAFAGTAKAVKYVSNIGGWMQPDGLYSWTPFEVWFPDRDCVSVGMKTSSIVFLARSDYKWVEIEDNYYCLKKIK